MTRAGCALLAVAPLAGVLLGVLVTNHADDAPDLDERLEHTDPRDGRVWLDPELGDWKACAGSTLILTLGDTTHQVPYAPECEITP